MRLAPALLLVLLLAGGASADDDATAAEKMRTQVAALIEQLRADDYATRRKARQMLQGLGQPAHEALSEYADDEDAEVRRTVRELLGPGYKPKQPVVEPGRLDVLAQVTVKAGTTSLRKALTFAGNPVGARFKVPDDHPDKLTVNRDVSGPAFEVFATLLDNVGLHQPRGFDSTGLGRLEARLPRAPKPPRAAHGPLEMRVVEVSATRSLTAKAKPKYSLGLELRWVPSVQVMQFTSPRIVLAKDIKGGTFVSTAGRSRTTYGVSYVETARKLPLGLMPDAGAGAEHLERLVVEIPSMRLRTGPVEVRFDDLAALPQTRDGTGAVVKAGTKGAIELRGISKEGSDRHPQYVMELVGVMPNATARASATVFVIWSDGDRQRLHVMGGRSVAADGTINLTVRAWPRGKRTPKAVIVRWFERETEGSLQFKLRDIPLR